MSVGSTPGCGQAAPRAMGIVLGDHGRPLTQKGREAAFSSGLCAGQGPPQSAAEVPFQLVARVGSAAPSSPMGKAASPQMPVPRKQFLRSPAHPKGQGIFQAPLAAVIQTFQARPIEGRGIFREEVTNGAQSIQCKPWPGGVAAALWTQSHCPCLSRPRK